MAGHRAAAAILMLLCFAPELEQVRAKKSRRKRDGGARPLGPLVYENVLSDAECDVLLDAAKQQPAGVGKIGGGGETDARTRRSTVRSLPRDQFEDVYTTITQRVTEANEAKWKFTGLQLQAIQLGEYSGETQGFYTWHVDQSVLVEDLDPATHRLLPARSARGWRVLSATLQLSPPSNYTGGELLVGSGVAGRPSAERGTLVVFPSYAVHTVRPVLSGTRYSLVIWLDGVDPTYAENAAREQSANVAAIADSGESGAELAYQLLAKTQHSLGKTDGAAESCRLAVQLAQHDTAASKTSAALAERLIFCYQLLALMAFNTGSPEEGLQLQRGAVTAAFGKKTWESDSTLAGWNDPEALGTVEQLATMMSKMSGRETEAIELLHGLCAADSATSSMHVKLGAVLGAQKRLKEAESALSRAVTLASKPQEFADALVRKFIAFLC